MPSGITEQRLNQWVLTLVKIGAIPENDPRPHALRTFSAPKYESLLKALPDFVDTATMIRALGCSKSQLTTLHRDGVLEPLLDSPKLPTQWRLSDAVKLVEDLESLSEPISSNAFEWERLHVGARRTGMKVGEIIKAVRSRKLTLGRSLDAVGYQAYVVSKTQLDRLAGQKPHIRRRAETIPSGEIASRYAERIGLKGRSCFKRLFEAGLVTACWVPHPVTGAKVLYLTEDDMAAFQRKFAVPQNMSAEYGLAWKTIEARLRRAGVKRFVLNEQGFGPLYERTKIEAALGPPT